MILEIHYFFKIECIWEQMYSNAKPQLLNFISKEISSYMYRLFKLKRVNEREEKLGFCSQWSDV